MTKSTDITSEQGPTSEFGIVSQDTPLGEPTFVKTSLSHRPDIMSDSMAGYVTLNTPEDRNQAIAQQQTWLPK